MYADDVAADLSRADPRELTRAPVAETEVDEGGRGALQPPTDVSKSSSLAVSPKTFAGCRVPTWNV